MTTTDTPAKPQRTTTPTTPAPLGHPAAPPEPLATGGTRLFTPRGRHRRPRPRKVLLVAGGLALAAGALSLVRLTPDSGVTGLGTAEAEPRPDDPGTATGTDRATNAAATVAVPKVSPSATAALGGTTATPVPGVSLAPAPAATGSPSAAWTAPTTIPQAPNTPGTPAPTATSGPPSATPTPPPQPAPTPSHTSNPPAPQPDQPGQPDRPDLCVPVVGLCVG
ncbi:hypothetical protein [Streptomyces sp. YU58]|uniref:hypothetical protein n=1 Tax=Streptomyces sp. SX92 TaxID=3158972 RepID=UPI0027B9AD7B|nr:hypothetical protein [Streptomyces coralus]WLW52629.1 hypothetical protein QU709_15095 [Streptomyces coralus]